MFDFDAFERELDEQNIALESMIAEMDVAQEGLFKPRTLDQMLNKVQKQVDKKCKSVDACDDLLAKLKKEEAKFNASLKTMKNAALQFKADGDKKALKAAIGPASKDLKKTCDLINFSDVVDNKQDVTDADIKKLHDFLVGTRKIINDKKKALKSGGAMEGMFDMDYTDMDMYMDVAMEKASRKKKNKNNNANNANPEPQATANNESEEQAKKKKKFNDLGAIQGIQKSLATTCYKMADRCKHMANDKKFADEKGFWFRAWKIFNSLYQKLSNRLTEEQLNACKEKCAEWQKKVDEKRAKKAEKKAGKSEESPEEEANEAAMFGALEQALSDVYDGLAQCSVIAVEMQMNYYGEYDPAFEAAYSDFDFALEADADKEDKEKDKEKKAGKFQALRRTLATHCYKMAQRCKRWANDEKFANEKGIFYKLYKMYTSMQKKLTEKLSDSEIATLDKKIKEYDEKIEKAKNKAKAETAKEAYAYGYADYGVVEAYAAIEQSMSYVGGILEQCEEAAIELEIANFDMDDDDFDFASESYFDFDDDDFDFATESFGDPFLDYAMEALDGVMPDAQRAFRIKYSDAKKECKANLKQAKSAAKSGNYKEAIKYVTAAKKGFLGMKAVAKKLPNRTGQVGDYKSMTKVSLLNWIGSQISKCDNMIEKYQIKMKKASAAKESYFDFDDDFDFASESFFDFDDEDIIL